MSPNKTSQTRFWTALWQFLSRSFILLGLPLIAWGLGDLAGFFSNPVRSSFAVVAIAQAFVHAWMVYILPPQPKHEPRLDLAHWHISLFEIIFILSAYGDRRNILTWDENMALRWVGLGIYLIGVGLSIWTNLTWVNHQRRDGEHAVDNPVLLSDGLFKWIRYPSLLYLIFYCLGVAIIFRSWIGLALIIPLIAAIINRFNNLDRIYSAQYNKVWVLRCQSSKRIIPFLF